ncbi:hypothetical protein CK224_12835 [Mesorhizobium sp. WSM3862]|nr:hypothetical protein CK224_12835 [Mesorhizobium sp. WSM3862]
METILAMIASTAVTFVSLRRSKERSDAGIHVGTFAMRAAEAERTLFAGTSRARSRFCIP